MDSDRVIAAEEISVGQREASAGTASDRLNEESTSDPPKPTSIDIIISDLGMPEEDGYEFMRKVRLLSPLPASQSPGIPAIALTGYATGKDRERALAAGYQLHLAKPVEPQELVDSILTLLRP